MIMTTQGLNKLRKLNWLTPSEKKLVNDILEARDIIKEMREAIEFDRAMFESFACSFQRHDIISEMERAKLCEKDCLPILEKTKEYE